MRIYQLRDIIANLDDNLEVAVSYDNEYGDYCELFPSKTRVENEYFVLEVE